MQAMHSNNVIMKQKADVYGYGNLYDNITLSTIFSNTICHRWSGGPVVAGDHLQCDSTYDTAKLQPDTFRAFGERKFGKLIDQPIGY